MDEQIESSMKIDDLENLKEPLHKMLLITNRERVTLQWQNLSSSDQSKQHEQQHRLKLRAIQ